MNRIILNTADAPAPGEAPSDAFLELIAYRFREVRAAKQFARRNLEAGCPPAALLAGVREMCRRSYAPMRDDDREVMTDLVMTAIASVIADWTVKAPPSPLPIDRYIAETVRANSRLIGAKVIPGRYARKA
jgi:hypothetical protein